MSKIIVIRIRGRAKLSENIEETLFRLKLRTKYSAVLLEDNTENKKMLMKIRSFVAYGPINEEMHKKLLHNKKEKSFFRLHPPKGGIETKKHYPIGKGALGDNKEDINKLLEKML